MGKALDLTGMRFGKLTVIGVDPDWIPKNGCVNVIAVKQR